MNELQPYFDLLTTFDHGNITALDRAHGMFLYGSVVAKKPQNILELGVGTGYITLTLLHAIRYNRCGKLTSVDNWLDYGGKEPGGIDDLRQAGVDVVTMSDGAFVRQAPADTYDLLVSDADHFSSHNWLDEYLRITRQDAFLFFHDTNTPELFPGLASIEGRVRAKGLPCYHFTASTRPDERCNRGWLFVINSKALKT